MTHHPDCIHQSGAVPPLFPCPCNDLNNARDELAAVRKCYSEATGQLVRLREAAVAVCFSVERMCGEHKHTSMVQIDDRAWRELDDLAMYAGCTNVSWWPAFPAEEAP